MPGIPELRGTHRYGFTFLSVMGTFVLLSAGGNSVAVRLCAVALQTLTLVLVFYTGGITRYVRHVVLGILLAGVLVVGLSFLGSTDLAKGMAGIVNATFVVTAIGGIVLGLRRQTTVDLKTIMGALSIYLLIGLFFAWSYSAMSAFKDGAFFAGGQTDTIAHLPVFSYSHADDIRLHRLRRERTSSDFFGFLPPLLGKSTWSDDRRHGNLSRLCYSPRGPCQSEGAGRTSCRAPGKARAAFAKIINRRYYTASRPAPFLPGAHALTSDYRAPRRSFRVFARP